ncbi:MAG: alpha/beta hydrolase [Xanthobacteraceae bacterium]|nr:alpha/beta hydrolase [Xanthobacteraceae bacterium]
MEKVEIRPGVWMAYEDHWFGAPWTTPHPVVMIHGNSESSRAWTQWVPHLAGKYRVVRPDLPGFGASSEPTGYGWTAAELAADIGRFLAALAIERCHLIGAKYGGSACMQFAAGNSHRLRSLCLLGSPFRGSGSGNADAIRTKGVREWAAQTQRARLGSEASDAQVRWWTDELMAKTSARAAFGAASARIDMDLDAMLPRITVPTLIVTTQESGLQSIATVERHAARLSDAEVIVLPGDSYHIAASAPELCAQHVLRFIDAVAQGRRAARELTTIGNST